MAAESQPFSHYSQILHNMFCKIDNVLQKLYILSLNSIVWQFGLILWSLVCYLHHSKCHDKQHHSTKKKCLTLQSEVWTDKCKTLMKTFRLRASLFFDWSIFNLLTYFSSTAFTESHLRIHVHANYLGLDAWLVKHIRSSQHINLDYSDYFLHYTTL